MSNQTQKGTVGWAGSNNFRGKILHSFRIDGVDKFFGTGEKDPGLQRGETIEFKWEPQGNNNVVDISSITHISGAPVVVGSPSSRSAASKTSAQSGYWDERLSRDVANDEYRKENDIRIQYQSARNAAIEWVLGLVKLELLKLPATGKQGVVDAALSDYTQKFFKETTTLGVETPVVDSSEEKSL